MEPTVSDSLTTVEMLDPFEFIFSLTSALSNLIVSLKQRSLVILAYGTAMGVTSATSVCVVLLLQVFLGLYWESI